MLKSINQYISKLLFSISENLCTSDSVENMINPESFFTGHDVFMMQNFEFGLHSTSWLFSFVIGSFFFGVCHVTEWAVSFDFLSNLSLQVLCSSLLWCRFHLPSAISYPKMPVRLPTHKHQLFQVLWNCPTFLYLGSKGTFGFHSCSVWCWYPLPQLSYFSVWC